jgi:hypothetical protein
MAISLKRISKLVDLDLSDIPKNKQKTVKKEVGEYIIDEILSFVSEGKSPVIGEKTTFKKLNTDYAKAEKNGDRNPDLELLGDMLDSLTFKNTKKGIEVGIFKANEVPKADGHNNFSGKSTLPTRRFIPKGGQKFRRSIQSGIDSILNEFSEDETTKILKSGKKSQAIAKSATTATLNDMFSDEGLEQFLVDEGFI